MLGVSQSLIESWDPRAMRWIVLGVSQSLIELWERTSYEGYPWPE